MPLIRRQCREFREPSKQQNYQQPRIIPSLDPQSSNADATNVVDESFFVPDTAESFPNCDNDAPKNESKSRWNTFWRQMNGPPPYRTKQNLETFCLALERTEDRNFEIRYYVEEPMERDPHCDTVDRAQAAVCIGPDQYSGNVTADWRELTSAVNGETILSLAVDFPTKRPTLSVEERNEEIERFETIDISFQFFLGGLRHAKIDVDNYKKKCPVDCGHTVHQPGWRPLQELPKPVAPFVLPSSPILLFSSYPCHISSSPSAPLPTRSFKHMASLNRKEDIRCVEENKKPPPNHSNAVTPLIDSSNSFSVAAPRNFSRENTTTTSSTAATAAAGIGANPNFFQMNLYRSIIAEHPSLVANGLQHQRNKNELLQASSTSSKTVVQPGNESKQIVKRRFCFQLNATTNEYDTDDVYAHSVAAGVPGTSHSFATPLPLASAAKLSKPTTEKKSEWTLKTFGDFALTLVNSERLKNGNLYAKTQKKQASYYMHVPHNLRKITNAVKNEIECLEINVPILDRQLLFLEMKSPSSDAPLYKQLNNKKNSEWIPVGETGKLANTFILVQVVDPQNHQRAQKTLFDQVDKILKPNVNAQ